MPEEIELSPDQQTACNTILASINSGGLELVLTGAAGTGKTTLVRYLLSDFIKREVPFALVAPTGKAASRLKNVTGRLTHTVHQLLYSKVKKKTDEFGNDFLHFSGQRLVGSANFVVICDEASMLGSELYLDLRKHMHHKAVLLCIGDKEQLEPVNDTWGANFAAPTADLKVVHRQARGSPIIQVATAVRTGQDWTRVPTTEQYVHSVCDYEEAANWLAQHRATGSDATLLTYTNRSRHYLNGLVRKARGFKSRLTVGDRIVCTRTNRDVGLMNGEVCEVKSLSKLDNYYWQVHFSDSGDDWFVVHIDALAEGGSADLYGNAKNQLKKLREVLYAKGKPDIAGDLMERFMSAEYGECLTTHKSQGSQWKHVGIVVDNSFRQQEKRDPVAFKRLFYTAVTRAETNLTLFIDL